MAQAKRKSNKTARYFTDEEKGVCHLPPNLGTGANIRFITPDGAVTQSNPKAFRALKGYQRHSLVGTICASLGIPTKEQPNPS